MSPSHCKTMITVPLSLRVSEARPRGGSTSGKFKSSSSYSLFLTQRLVTLACHVRVRLRLAGAHPAGLSLSCTVTLWRLQVGRGSGQCRGTVTLPLTRSAPGRQKDLTREKCRRLDSVMARHKCFECPASGECGPGVTDSASFRILSDFDAFFWDYY